MVSKLRTPVWWKRSKRCKTTIHYCSTRYAHYKKNELIRWMRLIDCMNNWEIHHLRPMSCIEHKVLMMLYSLYGLQLIWEQSQREKYSDFRHDHVIDCLFMSEKQYAWNSILRDSTLQLVVETHLSNFGMWTVANKCKSTIWDIQSIVFHSLLIMNYCVEQLSTSRWSCISWPLKDRVLLWVGTLIISMIVNSVILIDAWSQVVMIELSGFGIILKECVPRL